MAKVWAHYPFFMRTVPRFNLNFLIIIIIFSINETGIRVSVFSLWRSLIEVAFSRCAHLLTVDIWLCVFGIEAVNHCTAPVLSIWTSPASLLPTVADLWPRTWPSLYDHLIHPSNVEDLIDIIQDFQLLLDSLFIWMWIMSWCGIDVQSEQ